MKRIFIAVVVILLSVAPAAAQSNDDGFVFEQKQVGSRGAGGGERVQGQIMYGGAYMMVPDGHAPDPTIGPASALLTFNGDGCADSTPLWDGELGVLTGVNGAPHGTWRYEGATRIVANLYYFNTTRAGVLDRVGRATLRVDLGDDLAGGNGQIVFKSYLPTQLPAVLDDDNEEEPLGGTLKLNVRLIRLR